MQVLPAESSAYRSVACGATLLLIVLTATVALPMAAAPPVRVSSPPVAQTPSPPQTEFAELFANVQLSQLFADDKTFADARPLLPPAQILQQYRQQSPATPAALLQFVQQRFELPTPAAAPPNRSEQTALATHIDTLWDVLTRSTPSAAPDASLLPLPRPYVVPGGRFREIYYWDSYFTLLGLRTSGREDLMHDMVDDFAALLERFGHIPNGTRSYYLSRSQPPFFFAMVGLLSPQDEAAADARYLSQLQREYAYWMQGGRPAAGAAIRNVVRMPDGSLLNRYWDEQDTPRDEAYRIDALQARASGRTPQEFYRDVRAAAESGWDFSSRWFADGQSLASIDTTQIVPVDLNSLLYGLERAIGRGCERRGEPDCVHEFARRARQRRDAMHRYLWDAAAGAYLDYRWTRGVRVPRVSAATLYPLFVGLATHREALAVARVTLRQLLRAGGVAATVQTTGQQWDAPNGWAPLQWIAIQGLRRYDQSALAATIACRWVANVGAVYVRSGKLVEKYDVVTLGQQGGGGEYPTQDGFGWTNGVTRALLDLYPEDGALSVEQCPPPTSP